MRYLLIYVSLFPLSGIPCGIHLITRLHVQPFGKARFRAMLTTASADFSQFVVTTANGTACETSRDKPVSLSSSTCLIYAYGLRLPFGFHCFMPACPPQTPYYQVSVRQATISLSLLLAYTSRCKPWESLWGSSATTPHVDFHHRLAACPPYIKRGRLSVPFILAKL